MTEEIVTTLLGISGPEALALKVGAALVTDLLRHPEDGSPKPVGVISSTPGRLRFRQASVKRSPEMARRVEARLASLGGVRSATASPITGTVLVRYDEQAIAPKTLIRIAELADAALRVVPSDDDYRLPKLEGAATR